MSSNRLDAYLELYGPNRSLLIRDDDGGGDFNARIKTYRLPESGTYAIVAHSADDRPGAYALTLRLEP